MRASCFLRTQVIDRDLYAALYSPSGVNMENRTLDKTFAALSDPHRREILQELTRGRARVTKLAAPFSISLNSVSKHIKLLEDAGLVVRNRQGREHFIELQPRGLEVAKNWILEQERFWSSSLRALDQLLKEDVNEEED